MLAINETRPVIDSTRLVPGKFSQRYPQANIARHDNARSALSPTKENPKSSSSKSQYIGYQQAPQQEYSYLISMQNKCLFAVPLTKETFLEAYSKGKWNLSTVPCPSCYANTTLLRPPEAYNEAKRLKAVDSYSSLPHWDNTQRFNSLLTKTMNMFECNGASISLIDTRYQVVKFQHNLGFKECARTVSIDAHAILSAGFFALTDASQDWRTASNPLVKGPPGIRYYVAVPLATASKDVIGTFAIFDAFPRTKVEENTVSILQQIAAEIMEYLDEVHVSVADTSTTVQCSTVTSPTSAENTKIMLKKYGRATSSDMLGSIYERDGSGSRYQQHSHLRFSKYSTPLGDLIDLNVWRSLLGCMNAVSASKMLSHILMERLGFNCVYVMNIRVTELFRINSDLFPKENEIESETYKFKDMLQAVSDENISMKLLGGEGYPENLNVATFQPNFHYKAFKSDFGIIYDSRDSKAKYHSGVCMPFFRKTPKLVRRRKMSKNQRASAKNRDETLQLYHKSGGCLITCFSTANKDLNDREIGYIYGCASILRRLYFMS
ncbi:hypothetical protein KL930_003111 [Ogataea haglerorum]|uniref:GAF domain-containing protein n=1 Tax=Ogataea haglerorum TaxID=1937702 RepID=A0AAN6I061_9ASCO|nr:hypothetical protein KL950_002113 [Ogataea haglerorum]KAG7725928.1 hypothetical protein KL933_003976 [Ogataea haglerorum]KAG7734403.1 hypothetical protein KL932_004857 [Ogataea haglerorum]KAG7738872.1 hypothetical protein KL923_002672 [Ogataea haglerorum]KAG7758832.1 hypothetical protein KL947_002501 [Ogataea haglerorum]